ncbi:MAG: type II toxin-antitoxin system VapC family toxin [Methanosarcinales archaeon]
MLHRDFYDTSTLIAGLSRFKKDKKDIERRISPIKVISRSKSGETFGFTSYLVMVEFGGVLATKAKETLEFIEEAIECFKKFNIKIIYPTYRVQFEEEYAETSSVMERVLQKWSEDVLKISAKYQLNGLDASHLLTAVEHDCTRFITWDDDFLSNPNFRTKSIKELKGIQITSPERIT